MEQANQETKELKTEREIKDKISETADYIGQICDDIKKNDLSEQDRDGLIDRIKLETAFIVGLGNKLDEENEDLDGIIDHLNEMMEAFDKEDDIESLLNCIQIDCIGIINFVNDEQSEIILPDSNLTHQQIKDQLKENGCASPSAFFDGAEGAVNYLLLLAEEMECELVMDPLDLARDIAELGLSGTIQQVYINDGVLSFFID